MGIFTPNKQQIQSEEGQGRAAKQSEIAKNDWNMPGGISYDVRKDAHRLSGQDPKKEKKRIGRKGVKNTTPDNSRF